MAFGNDDELAGYEIRHYNPHDEISDTTVAYRISTNFDGDGGTFEEQFERFLQDEGASKLKAVSIGFWGNEWADVEMCHNLPELLIEAAKGPLKDIEALFVGDISYEEAEVSWIEQFELGEAVNAFKKLKHFKARGGNGLGLTGLKHDALETLIVETGALSGGVVRAIAAAELPNLKHLEIWTGSSSYDADVTIEDVMPLLTGSAYPEMKYPFPKLKYLGIVNSEIADAVAQLIPGSKASAQIEQLDLSRGLLSNDGMKALAEGDDLGSIKTLIITNSYVGDEELIDRVRAKGVEVLDGGQRSAEEDYWYVEVGE